MRQSFRFLAAALLSFSFMTGCGGRDENQVVQPSEDYQLTDQEKKNAGQSTAAADKSGFTGN